MKNNNPKNSSKLINELLPLAVCEGAVVLLILLGAGILHFLDIFKFNITVLTGALLGALVTVVNYLFLTLSVDRAVNNYMTMRGDREMTDEEAQKFAAENSMPIQNAIKTSFIIRTISMLAALLVAFLTKWFNPLATAIPLLAFRPLLSVIEMIKGKKAADPNPENFIKYENEEKESDE